MKYKLFNPFIVFILLFLSAAFLQAQDTTKAEDKPAKHGQHFIDLDGDGYNDNAPDHDGDGIPNGLDKDWKKLKKKGEGKGKGRRRRFVDLDGDGIDDNLQAEETGQGTGTGIKKEMSSQDNGASMNQQQNGQGTGTGQRKRQGRN